MAVVDPVIQLASIDISSLTRILNHLLVSDKSAIVNNLYTSPGITGNSLVADHSSITSMLLPVTIHWDNSQSKVPVYALTDTQTDTTPRKAKIAKHFGSGMDTSLPVSTNTSQSKILEVKEYTNIKVEGIKSKKALSIPEVFTTFQ